MSLAWTAVGMTVLSAAVGFHQSEQARKATNTARDRAAEQAKATLMQQDEADNRLNQKQANTQSLLEAAVNGNKGGAASTLLTGPSGVNTSNLTLGRNSLLGG